MTSPTPPDSRDELDDIDKILALFAKEIGFPEVIRQYSNYKETRTAIEALIKEEKLKYVKRYQEIQHKELVKELIDARIDELERLKQFLPPKVKNSDGLPGILRISNAWMYEHIDDRIAALTAGATEQSDRGE